MAATAKAQSTLQFFSYNMLILADTENRLQLLVERF